MKHIVHIVVKVTLMFVGMAGICSAQQHWVEAWGTAPHAPIVFPGQEAGPPVSNVTYRMVILPTLGASHVRVQLSNAFGTTGLAIGSATIARSTGNGAIDPVSLRPLHFAGKGSVKVPPGASVESDTADIVIRPGEELAISLYLPESAPISTVHKIGQRDIFTAIADQTSAPSITTSNHEQSWYWLSGLLVQAPASVGAIVTLGDSITDGYGSTPGTYRDWPDQLALRLQKAGGPPRAVVNEGIGGNRVLNDGMGVNTLARFDRDVLDVTGARDIIVLEGINDIGWPHMKPPPNTDPKIVEAMKHMSLSAQQVTAEDLIGAFTQMIARAHEHGIRIHGATILPFQGANYFSEVGEDTRQKVNIWIRTSGAFDSVIDFDAAVRDLKQPLKMRDDFQIGDHLHPNDAGYKAMAEAINLNAFTTPDH